MTSKQAELLAKAVLVNKEAPCPCASGCDPARELMQCLLPVLGCACSAPRAPRACQLSATQIGKLSEHVLGLRVGLSTLALFAAKRHSRQPHAHFGLLLRRQCKLLGWANPDRLRSRCHTIVLTDLLYQAGTGIDWPDTRTFSSLTRASFDFPASLSCLPNKTASPTSSGSSKSLSFGISSS